MTNPLPYIALSYTIGLVLLAGYWLWLLKQRAKLRNLEKALIEESAN